MNTVKRVYLMMGLCLITAVFAAYNQNTLAMGRDETKIAVSQTATAVWQREFLWSINQSVTPETWFLFEGDTGTTRYTVDVTKVSAQDTYRVRGKITVNNTGVSATQGLKIVNCIQYKLDAGEPMKNLQCTDIDLGSKPFVSAGTSNAYPYEITFTPIPGARYQMLATVTITNAVGHMNQPYAVMAKAGFHLPGSPTRTINETVTVTDSNGRTWTFNDSGTQTYDTVLDCAGLTFVDEQAAYTQKNTAVITETGESAATQVAVNCYRLRILGDPPSGSMSTSTTWAIDKTADVSELNLEVGEQTLVNYEVTVDVAEYTYWIYIENPFSVYNPNPQRQAVLVDLDIGGDVDCYDPAIVPPGERLYCDYRADQRGTNTFIVIVNAEAVIQNYDLAPDGSAAATGTTVFATEFVGDVSRDPDAGGCAWVDDSLAGEFEPVCWWSEPVTTTITYPWWVGPYEACGVYEVENTATIEGYGGDSASWTVQVTVPCTPE